MMLPLLLANASATVANVPLKLCFKYDIDYNEGVSGTVGPGDYWVNNDVDRAARGLFIQVSSSASLLQRKQLDESGCWQGTHPIELDGGTGTFVVTLLGEGERHGTRVELRNNNERELPTWPDATMMTHTWIENQTSPFGSTHDYVIQAQDGWQLLAAAMSALTFYDWKLDEGVPRACCIPGEAGYDGLCNKPKFYYAKDKEPYGPPGEHFLAILADNGASPRDPTAPEDPDDNPWDPDRSNNCCGSKLPWDDDGEFSTDLRSGLWIGSNVPWRFAITHELGHVVVGMRMGDYERGQYGKNAPHDGCNGDRFEVNGILTELSSGKRGVFQKEYMAQAFREGWADFFTTLAWNQPTTTNVDNTSFLFQDFDIDGDVDNDSAPDPSWPYRKTHRLTGNPEQPGEPGGTSQADWMQSFDRNWRATAAREVATCTWATPTCTNGLPQAMEAYNRSTIYDVSSFYWHLLVDEGLQPPVLSDLYVSTCPRVWRVDDDEFNGLSGRGCELAEDLPWIRLIDAAEHLGIRNELLPHEDRVIGW